MSTLHPYFIFGLIGMVITVISHILVVLFAEAFNEAIFLVLYLIFGFMMLFGSDKRRKLERVRIRRK